MSIEIINKNIRKLIQMRRVAKDTEQKRINIQLDKLYQFKYELLKGE